MIRRHSAVILQGSRHVLPIHDGNAVLWAVARNRRCSNFSSSAPSPSATNGGKTTNSTPPTAIDSSSSGSKFDHWLEAWNEHSGTHEISKLKELVHNSSLKFDKQQRLVADARKAIDHALSTWEESQIKHAQLMQVRDKWTPAQALEFAKLLEKEVQVRSNLEQAKKDLAEKETHQSKLQIDYMNNLRKRYHEEQIWTDKWRILSTYGTWGLIALNSVVFLISQYLFKVRERSRMKDFETLLKETLSSNTSTMLAIREHQNDIVELQQQQQRNESQNNENDKSRESEGESSNNQSTIKIETEEGERTALLTANRGEETKQQSGIIYQDQSSDKDDGDKQKLADSILGSESKREPSSSVSKQPSLLSTLQSKAVKHDKDQKIARAVKQASDVIKSSWASVQTRAKAAKIDSADRIDLASAALGACVTSVAWLVAMSFSRKGGQ
mmetsp:Transcript_23221/g.38258  ORF Transcript_23221/g.38258 Transcript_23221/m.38258 type:complete len:442 (-) Transcript_23221:68-1393(-)